MYYFGTLTQRKEIDMKVDLTKLQRGDVVHLRNGETYTASGGLNFDNGVKFLEKDMEMFYENDGRFHPKGESPLDIVKVVKNES